MHTQRNVLLAVLVFGLGACGGRSSLKLPGRAGGGDAGVPAATDVRPDGQRDAATTADAPLEVRRDALDAADASRADGRADGAADGVRDVAVREARGDAGAPDAAPTVTRLEIAPPSVTIALGVPYGGFTVTAVRSDGTTADVTAQATLASGDSAIVQVSGRTLTGLKAGSTSIKATYAALSATATVTVTASPLQSITIDGAAPVPIGQSLLLTATGVFADGTKQDITAQATWTSHDLGLATVAFDSASGKEKLTGLGAGTLSVTATLSGITGKVAITVTSATLTRIEVVPAQAVLQVGVARAFQATGTYSDGTTGDLTSQASWTSGNPAVATVTAAVAGVTVKGVAAGTASISAAVGAMVGTATVTVTAPTLVSIALGPATWSPIVGGTQAFTATGTYSDGSAADLTLSATWSSTNGTVASVSSATGSQGVAVALAAGSAQIQATFSGITGRAAVTVTASPLVSITILPDPLALVVGLEANLVATGNYQNGATQALTAQVAWSSADPSIAAVSNGAGTAGQVTGVGAGTTAVYASLGGVTGKATVVVAQAKLIAITVAPSAAKVTAGSKQAFAAKGSFDNGTGLDLTAQVTWSSSDVGVAQVSNAAGSNGVATTLVAGRVTITASLGGIAGSATLTVGDPLLSSLQLTPASAILQVGGTRTFTVTAVYQNGTTAAVAGTWSSANPAVATVVATEGGRGVATGVAPGQTTITASYQGLSATAQVTVTQTATLAGLTITPATPPSLLVGATQQFQASAIMSDGSSRQVTAAASWTSSAPEVASVSNGGEGAGRPGRATGIGAGTTTIIATYEGFTASVALTVRDPEVTGLVVTPVSATIKVGATQQFAALATYEDGTTATVTGEATWTTSNAAIASIRSGGGGGGGRNAGQATGLGAGTVTVTATWGGFSGTASLTVSAATAVALVVTPASASLQVGQTQAFAAALVWSDGSTTSVTSGATWTSSDISVATVRSPAGGGGGPPGAAGLATAIGAGVSTIGASYGGFSGSATLTVNEAPLAFVQVTPTNPTIPLAATAQFTATAIFTDNTTRNVTALATWSSSDTAVAVVTNGGPNAGRASAVGEGAATITATYQGVSGSSVLTVAGSVKSVSVTPVGPTTVLGVPVAFVATAILPDDTVFVVTGRASWVSSDPGIATVTAAGVASPVKSGLVKITATYLGQSSASLLTVSSATLSSIAVAPNPLTLAVGASQQLTATGAYSDGRAVDLTNVATWYSSAPVVATVSNASDSRGLLTAVGAGRASVTAVFQGVTSAPGAITVTSTAP